MKLTIVTFTLCDLLHFSLPVFNVLHIAQILLSLNGPLLRFFILTIIRDSVCLPTSISSLSDTKTGFLLLAEDFVFLCDNRLFFVLVRCSSYGRSNLRQQNILSNSQCTLHKIVQFVAFQIVMLRLSITVGSLVSIFDWYSLLSYEASP